MRKATITAAIMLLCAAANAQPAPKKDSVKSKPVLTDTTKILSISDINRLAAPYQDKATYAQYSSFMQLMGLISDAAAKEWEAKQKKD